MITCRSKIVSTIKIRTEWLTVKKDKISMKSTSENLIDSHSQRISHHLLKAESSNEADSIQMHQVIFPLLWKGIKQMLVSVYLNGRKRSPILKDRTLLKSEPIQLKKFSNFFKQLNSKTALKLQENFSNHETLSNSTWFWIKSY